MKAIHYDAEGDILSISFAESGEYTHTGVELSDNIVLYLDPVREEPVALILSSYQALLLAHAQTLSLDGLERMPVALRTTRIRRIAADKQKWLTTYKKARGKPVTGFPLAFCIFAHRRFLDDQTSSGLRTALGPRLRTWV